jgi:hypothetical protein
VKDVIYKPFIVDQLVTAIERAAQEPLPPAAE